MRTAIAIVVVCLGCSPASTPRQPATQAGPACVGLAFASLARGEPGPAPVPEKCPCGGTGKVRSGDGIAVIDCGCSPCRCSKACASGTCPPRSK